MMLTRLIFTRMNALLLAAGLLIPAVHAQVPANHVKKTAHKMAPKNAVPQTAWAPDPKLVATLGPEQQFSAFSMRIPVGYTLAETEEIASKTHSTSRRFSGQPDKDGGISNLIIVVGQTPPGKHEFSADDFMKSIILNPTVIGLTEGDKQRGMANNLEFVRQYFKYQLKIVSSRWMRCVYYATTSGQNYAFVMVWASEPHGEANFSLLQSAALTLHKIP